MSHPLSLALSTGDQLPASGLGLWKVPVERCPTLIVDAVDAGYRHFDCACDYGNEEAVGDGLRSVLASGACSRDDLWITSKLWNTFHRPEHVELACRKSLSDLGLEHLDLYLMHFPIAQRFVPIEVRYPPGWYFDPGAAEPGMELDRVPLAETWGAMERLRQQGLVKNIGVCNFGTALLRDLMNSCDVPPAVLQVESHPYLTQEKLLRFCQQAGIAYTAFSPFGAASYYELGMAERSDSLLEHPLIRDIAAAHQRTPAQVLLRWGVQRGTAVVPKTTSNDRVRENIAISDFSLSDAEMRSIAGLNQDRRYNDPGVFCERAFNTYCPIYE
ncbi:MAG: aldo/keto reductase [Planctomycetaceae bacterium]